MNTYSFYIKVLIFNIIPTLLEVAMTQTELYYDFKD